MPTSSKTKLCACGKPSGRNAEGKSIHPLTHEDVWFDEIDLGSTFKAVQVNYRHFANTHGIMGKMVHEATGTVFFITSATAMDFAIHHAGEELYPNAKN